MDFTVEITDWCFFERIPKTVHPSNADSYCELLKDNPYCEFGRTGEPAKECPLRKGRIILEWKDE